MELVDFGFYKIKDQYFSDFPSKTDRYIHNKSENRPYYLAFRENSGIIWLLPISSKVDKYKAKIESDEEKFGECITSYIIRYMSSERAVLIGNMIPVTKEYIRGEFQVQKLHYVVKDQVAIRAIRKRCSRYLSLVRAKKLFPAVNILENERKLIVKMKHLNEETISALDEADRLAKDPHAKTYSSVEKLFEDLNASEY